MSFPFMRSVQRAAYLTQIATRSARGHPPTFFAFGDALISRKALAPRSKASGSNDGALMSDSQSAYVTLPAAIPAAS